MAKAVTRVQDDKKRKVFVVYGRNTAARDAMYAFLRALSLEPIEWEQAKRLTGEGTPFVGRILEVGFREAHAVVVLLTGDDEAHLRDIYQGENDEDDVKTFTPQPRQNQIFEAGYAFGKFPRRTILVQIGRLREFSDIKGRFIPHFTGTYEDRHRLINSLKTVGCEVNDVGESWIKAGDFSLALR